MMILMIAGGLAMHAVAASPDNPPSVSTKLPVNAKHPVYEFWKPEPAPNYKIER
jgi:hypothetical protein